MNCLILGGGGFLGSHLAETLLRKGHRVRIFDRLGFSRENIESISADLDIFEGDFNDHSSFDELLDKIDIIFHLISTTTPKSSNENPIYDIESNVVSTLRLLEKLKDLSIKRVVYFSSGGTVYGIPQSLPISEDHVNYPLCSYGVQKLTIEKYLHLYGKLHGLTPIILRISNPYGPRQVVRNAQGVIASFIERSLRGETLEVWGDGSVRRDYIYIRDLMGFISTLLESDVTFGTFNIGSGSSTSLIEVINTLERVLDKKVFVDFKEGRPIDVPENVLDINRAQSTFLWKPRYSLYEGLRESIDYSLINSIAKK